MPGPIATAFVELRPDSDRFGPELEAAASRAFERFESIVRESLADVSASFDRMAREGADDFGRLERDGVDSLNRIEREANDGAGRIGGTFGRLGALLAGAFAGVQIAQFMRDSVDAAADLGESVNAINVVLGDGAAGFLAFGETAADQLGISQAALNEAIVPLGSLLSNAGLSGDALSGTLADVATRATDVASVFNRDVNEVLAAFGAAVRGETEPIRALGVNFDQAAVAARAVELGLAASTSEVDNAASAQAALSLVMEQTNAAAGDFANTAESLPNLMRRIQATGTELAAGFGSALLPAVGEVASSLLPLAESIRPVFDALGAALGPLIGQVGGVLGQLAPVIAGLLEDVAVGLAPLGAVLGSVVTAIAPFVAVLGDVFASVLPPLVEALQPALNAVAGAVALVGETIGEALAPVLPVIGELFAALAPLVTTVAEVFAELVGAVAPLLPPIGRLVAQVAGALAPVLARVAGVVADVASVLGEALGEALGTVLEALVPILPVLGRVADAFGRQLGDVLTALEPSLPELARSFGAMAGAMAELNVALLPLIEPLAELAILFIENISAPQMIMVAEAVALIATALAAATTAIAGFVSGAAGDLSDAVADVAALPGRISENFDNLVAFFGELPGRLVEALGDIAATIGGVFVGVGQAVISGLLEGITGLGDAVLDLSGDLLDAVADLGSGLLNGVIDALNNLLPNEIGAISLPGVGEIFGGVNLPDNPIPHLADGIFTRTPMHAVIGEAGPEVVIPLSRPRRAAELARQSGLIDLLGLAAPAPSVVEVDRGPLVGALTMVAPGPDEGAKALVRRLRVIGSAVGR